MPGNLVKGKRASHRPVIRRFGGSAVRRVIHHESRQKSPKPGTSVNAYALNILMRT
jgi:hypothetical protein